LYSVNASFGLKNASFDLGVVVHICDLSPQEVEAVGAQVQGLPGLHSGSLLKKE
jgi:hypothetical protein